MADREREPPSSRRRLQPAATLAILAIATLLAYSRVLDGEFQFDDATAVVENAAIRDLGRFVRQDLLGGFATTGRPVTQLTFAVDYAVGGLGVRAYHRTSVALHLAVAALVFLLTRKTLRRLGGSQADGLAAWTAGLFALHPLQSQAVSYLSQRAEVLASLFYLLACLLLLEAEERGATRRGALAFAGALVAFVLGLGSKQIVVTFPAAFLLYAAAFPRRGTGEATAAPARRIGRSVALAAPFLLLSAVYSAVQLGALRADTGVGFDLPSLGPWRYLLTQLRVILVYLRLLVWPAGQNLDYAFPAADTLLEPRTLLAALGLSTLVASALWGWRWSRSAGGEVPARALARLAAFGLFWFLLLLAPTSSVVPIRDVIEEHRVYLASWGVLLAFAAAARLVYVRLAGSGEAPRRAMAAAALGLWAVLGVATYQRNAVWETSLALWRDVVAKSPTKARAHENLGHALHRAGDSRGAAAEYVTALRLAADGSVPRAKLLNNVGASLLELGRLDEAVSFLSSALAEAPNDLRLLCNLAMSWLGKGELDAAEATARRAASLYPDDPGARNALGQILARKGDRTAAAAQFALEARLNPDAVTQVRGAAIAQERAGDVPGACASWERLLSMRPGADQEELARRRLAALGCPR